MDLIKLINEAVKDYEPVEEVVEESPQKRMMLKAMDAERAKRKQKEADGSVKKSDKKKERKSLTDYMDQMKLGDA